MSADNLEQWLENLPLDEPVDIDGETVFLKISGQGAELGVLLVLSYTDSLLADALRNGFQSALDFDAGLAIDGEDLILTQWLPYVGAWAEAAEALENILNQAAMWRAAMAYSGPARGDAAARHEDRVRKIFSGEMR